MFSVSWEDLYFNVVLEDGVVVKSFFSEIPAFNTDYGQFKEQLEDYFSGKRVEFDIPVRLNVTPFIRRVLEEVSKIPYGKTATYSDIAQKLKTSPRAVGQAVRRNPVPVIIPCHRVVAKNGLGGYTTSVPNPKASLKIKEKLLKLEGQGFLFNTATLDV
ncbi:MULTISPECIES: methylated-DNA--[protein]-cysteine S-methyltransferase [unclassified Archaeoglobus]|jgi:methylated-DNA-[protein]-cysteine S-methyltransferase|uniref:methylated-DNA--[protein]-cysteine S-methyltransferase n=1 Tax=unclassified Archaeoglobus TaxID=2643606 RepID=UPI0025BA0CE2|nr:MULTISPECIES: methylated-DNA--[protein]-cysteine S-methyltransferase [unclassified Archaeoglobus]